MKRTAAREIAIQLGFAATLTGQDPRSVVEMFFEPEHYASMAAEGELYAEKPSERDMAFITESVCGVIEHREELDRYISRYAKGWRVERISRSAVAVLRQALFEIMYLDDVPDAASMNEAVELAKGYEDGEVVAFINGILGGFYRAELLHEEPIPEDKPLPGESEAEVPESE